MKYLNFLRWHWNKLTGFGKTVAASITLILLGLIGGITGIPYVGTIVSALIVITFFVLFVKIYIWDDLVDSYMEFQEQQEKIVDIVEKHNDNVLQDKK